MTQSPPDKTKIEYEGTTYEVDTATITGLSDQQILNLLAPGFPGMAGGKLERAEDGSIKIIKRVGTKGNHSFVELLQSFPVDTLPVEIDRLNCQLTSPELTVAEWEQIDEQLNFEEIQQILKHRKQVIQSTLRRLYFCPSNIIPLI
ncbi:MAG: hypothetical protein ACRC2S_21660 [Waterburya sp.]